MGRLRAQDGFTLPELLVVLALLPIVAVALFNTLDTTAKLAPRSAEYANAIQQAGSGVSLAMRDVRQAYRIAGTTPNSVTFYAVLNGTDQKVNISCNITSTAKDDAGQFLRRCVKTTTTPNGTLPSPAVGQILVDRVINGTTADPVFEFSPDAIAPTFVRMVVKVPSRGEGQQGLTHSITIDNGTELRNNLIGS
jgi:prepilin-type N-terminal cleavage/methylation domain-containing protein